VVIQLDFRARLRRRFRRDQHGQVFALVAISLVGVIAMAAFVVDVSRFYVAHRQMQASTDAVATAVADQLPDVKAGTQTLAAAEASATNYGAGPGQKNAGSELNGVTLAFTPKCLTVHGSVPAWCTGSTPNAVVVTQQATVNSVFAKVVGINSAQVTAKATASMGGGKPIPAHIMIVLDRTGSMNSGCSAGGSKIQCAQAGIDAFLTGMDPSVDKVGLVVFSPASSAATKCNTPPNNNGWFDQTAPAPLWVLVPLSTDYKASYDSPLNVNSNLYTTYHCIKAGGSTAYATAIDQAQAVLAANHDPKAQDAIVFFTDGEANYGEWPKGNASPYRTQPCHQAINSAAAAKATGTWVYTIEYDSNAANTNCEGWKSSGSQNGSSCNTGKGIQFPCDEVPAITARSTLQQMATDSTKFYSEPNPGDLTTIFQDIAADLGGTMLVDDGYTGS
jgi:Flp pilus assembly protein TadG